ALHHVHARYDDARFLGDHAQHFAPLALVAARRDDDAVLLFDLRRHHSTSGARLMIFIWFFCLSSRVTGPKMRVPMGSPVGVTSTAALVSKRISEPSGRRTPLAVRTTTAFNTSPFFTRPRGIASFTLTTMVSPTSAYLRREPPRTLMHMTRRAPELSATSSSVVICIMICVPNLRSYSSPWRPTTSQVLSLEIGRHSRMRT